MTQPSHSVTESTSDCSPDSPSSILGEKTFFVFFNYFLTVFDNDCQIAPSMSIKI
jgi:hypothetical protein